MNEKLPDVLVSKKPFSSRFLIIFLIALCLIFAFFLVYIYFLRPSQKTESESGENKVVFRKNDGSQVVAGEYCHELYTKMNDLLFSMVKPGEAPQNLEITEYEVVKNIKNEDWCRENLIKYFGEEK